MNRDFKGRRLVSKLTAVLIGVIGFIMTIPFVYVVAFSEPQPYLSLGRSVAILLTIPGIPMFFYGIIGFLMGGKTMPHHGPMTETDLGRIRHAIEMDRMTRK